MFDKKSLCEFLVEAKKSTYAAGDLANKTINSDKSTILIFEKWDWKYHDNYFGWEPYGGREVVFFKENPVYIMTYYGRIYNFVPDLNKIYSFLMNSLKLIPEDKPYRGPEKYSEWSLLYTNIFTWEVDNFFGEEIITKNEKEIYKAKYIGGFVDIKN